MFRNDFFYKGTVGESGMPILLQKEYRGSAISDVSNVLFPDMEKMINIIKYTLQIARQKFVPCVLTKFCNSFHCFIAFDGTEFDS